MAQAQNTYRANTQKLNASQDLASALSTKVQPNSNEAEMSVLGGLLLNRMAFTKIVNLINEDSFYQPKHSEIFLSIKTIFEANKSVDLLTVREELLKRGKLEEIGGDAYIAQLNRRSPTAANIEEHALIVLEKYLKRLIIEISAKVMSNAYNDTVDIYDEIDRAESEIFKVAQLRHSKNYVTMKALAHDTMNYIMELSKKSEGGVTGVSSGFKDLDNMLGGFQNSDLIILAARPSMGKTALGLSVLLNVAYYNKVPTAFFSIEMDAKQIAVRLVSAAAKINQQKIRTGKLAQRENQQIVKSLSELAESPIVIDDSAYLDILELKAKCRRLKTEHDIKLIVVDYLQLLHAPKSESREREVSMISQSLKQIAKDLEVPVIALAQLNRTVEGRKDHRPMLQDLRESGSIEQDADVIMFVHRPERYGLSTLSDGTTPSDNMAEIIVGKQRNGPTGDVKLVFQKDYARFENYTYATEDQPQSMREKYGQDLTNVPPADEAF